MNPASKKKRPDVNDDEFIVSVNEVGIRKGVVLGSLSNTLIKWKFMLGKVLQKVSKVLVILEKKVIGEI